MSVQISDKGLFVGNHVWFCREGTTIPSTGEAVDNENIPSGEAPDVGCWLKLGEVTKVDLNMDVQTVEVKGPSPCHLETVDEEVTETTTEYTIDIETIPLQARELIFGTQIDTETGVGRIGSSPRVKGWLLWSAVDSDPSVVFTCNVWGILSKEGSTTFGGNDFTKATLKLKQLSSPLENKVQFNK